VTALLGRQRRHPKAILSITAHSLERRGRYGARKIGLRRITLTRLILRIRAKWSGAFRT